MATQFRHVHLVQPTGNEVQFLAANQLVAHFVKKFPSGWSAPNHILPPSTDRALWEDGASNAELRALADQALKKLPAEDGHVLVVHAPGKLAMVWSDKPVPADPKVAAIVGAPVLQATIPLQPVTDGPAPPWWP